MRRGDDSPYAPNVKMAPAHNPSVFIPGSTRDGTVAANPMLRRRLRGQVENQEDGFIYWSDSGLTNNDASIVTLHITFIRHGQAHARPISSVFLLLASGVKNGTRVSLEPRTDAEKARDYKIFGS